MSGREVFIEAVRMFQQSVHECAEAHGFWESTNTPEKIALIHSEVSELLEAGRKELESFTVGSDPVRLALEGSGVSLHGTALLIAVTLQRMHDGDSPSYWPVKLNMIEKEFFGV
jgi:hypothetical protein